MKLINIFILTFLSGAFNQRIPIRLVDWTRANGLRALDRTLRTQTTSRRQAGIHQGTAAQAAREGIPGAADLTAAIVTAHQILADGVGAARAGQAVVDVPRAFHVGVADEAGGTAAGLRMAEGFALGVDAAGVLPAAGVDTRARLALLVRLAVCVHGALDTFALQLGVALQALRAEAYGAVVGGAAFGGGGATAVCAGVNTLAGDTGSGGAAVTVAGTARQADSALAQVALQTKRKIVETKILFPVLRKRAHPETSVADPNPLVRDTELVPDPSIIKQIVRKTLIPVRYCLVTSL